MRLLVLGGTADGRHLATAFHQSDIEVIYSVAGLVRKPDVPCKIISGGFSQYGGLEQFLKAENISVILDATHPYAQTMSNIAVTASKNTGILCWRFHRKAWQSTLGDAWINIESWHDMLESCTEQSRVFLSAGQLEQEVLNEVAKQFGFVLFRTAVKPKLELPNNVYWLKAIGPFDKTNELALLQEYKIDLIVSKNSGGDATVAKLIAARELGITVAMFDRPELLAADSQWSDYTACVTDICHHFKSMSHKVNNHAV